MSSLGVLDSSRPKGQHSCRQSKKQMFFGQETLKTRNTMNETVERFNTIPDTINTICVRVVDAVYYLSPQGIKDKDVLLLAGRRQDLPIRVEL